MRNLALMFVLAAGIACTGCGGYNTPKVNDRTLPPIVRDDGFDMVLVEGGTFLMGCIGDECDFCSMYEIPARSVTVGGFYIGKTEVTQGLWAAVMGNNPSEFTGDDCRPVEYVSWDDIQEFIRKLNAMTGKNYRLPAEAEWEYAARGGNKSKGYKYSGGDNPDDVSWHTENSCWKTHPVGTKQPNESDLYDMNGNVAEWTNGIINEKYNCGYRVIRGGHYQNYGGVSHRDAYYPDGSLSSVGFRLAHDADTKILLQGGFSFSGRCGINDFAADSAERERNSAKDSVNNSDVEMVFVEGGAFYRGCTAEQGYDCEEDEKPAHRVTVRDFYIGKTEVTWGLWQSVMNDPCYDEDDRMPFFGPTKKFIEMLNAKTGKNYRLPTEEEWEYAARGGNKSKGYKYSGSDSLNDVAWYGCYWVEGRNPPVACYPDGNSDGMPHPVGTKAPNELGLYDMSGNMWEWVYVRDGFHNAHRGGSFLTKAAHCRVSSRYDYYPGHAMGDLGLRLAHDAD